MKLKIAIAVMLTSLMFQANASIITFTDRASFDSAAGSTTLLDFEAQSSGANRANSQGAELILGDVTFTQPNGRLFVFGEDFYSTNGLTSAYLNQNCCAPDGITATFANGIYALGMDLGIQNHWNGSSNNIVMTLSNGDVLNFDAPLLFNTNNTLEFFGFVSSEAISSVHFGNGAEATSIDNFAFTTAPVPAPAVAGLFLLGLLGVRLRRRAV